MLKPNDNGPKTTVTRTLPNINAAQVKTCAACGIRLLLENAFPVNNFLLPNKVYCSRKCFEGSLIAARGVAIFDEIKAGTLKKEDAPDAALIRAQVKWDIDAGLNPGSHHRNSRPSRSGDRTKSSPRRIDRRTDGAAWRDVRDPDRTYPQYGQRVLVASIDGRWPIQPARCFYRGGLAVWYTDDDETILNVTHWKPVPEGPSVQ